MRLLVKEVRLAPDEPSWAELYLRIAYAHESPEILLDKLAGLSNKHLPEDHGLRRS